MQIAAEATTSKSLHSLLGATFCEFSATVQQSPLSRYKVIRRNGAVAGFEQFKISEAVTKERHVRLRFDDGLAGSVFPDDVLETRAFGGRRDAAGFCSVAVDPVAATVVCDDGIRPNPDSLYQDLLSGRPGKGFSSSGLALMAE
jgi:hypothetical protein